MYKSTYNYDNKLNNLEEMDTFIETQNLSRLNHDNTENLNKPVIGKDVESIIKNLPTNKSSIPHWFTGKFFQTFKRE